MCTVHVIIKLNLLFYLSKREYTLKIIIGIAGDNGYGMNPMGGMAQMGGQQRMPTANYNNPAQMNHMQRYTQCVSHTIFLTVTTYMYMHHS